MDNSSLIIVTPIYEDTQAAGQLFEELGKIFGKELFIVAVDDGSIRNPFPVNLITGGGVVIRLKRNVGHQKAIAVGLGYVAENIKEQQKVIVMDSDGEDTPASVKELLTALENESVDIVVAQRKSRVETLKFKAFYVLYKFVFKMLSGKKINFGNFMALKSHAVKRLVFIQELGIHVAATVLLSKLRLHFLAIDRGSRYAGKSKMNFIGLVLHGFRALMVFSEDVLVKVGVALAIVSGFSVIGSVMAIILKLLGFATPGWFSTALGILLIVFLQTGTIALMILMLTGVLKNNNMQPDNYKNFIDETIYTEI